MAIRHAFFFLPLAQVKATLMKSLVKLGQVILYVADMGASVNFYQDCLGLPVSYPGPDVDLSAEPWVTFETGATSLALHSGGPGNMPADAPSITFMVEDLDTAYRDVMVHGVKLSEISEPHPGVRLCSGKDPDGHVFILQQS